MFKKAHQLPSRHMERSMWTWQYGDYGAPLLVFPSAAGMAHEWEAQGMIAALEPLIGTKLKIYCVESNVSEAWTRKEADPAWRIGRHLTYERFVLDELVPWIRDDCRTPDIPISCTGTSLGATYAVNAVLKHPGIFRFGLCMSGRYNIRDFNSLGTADVYFNNPLAYVWGMEGGVLDEVREKAHLDLVCGRGPWEDGNWQETQKLGELLKKKGISCHLDLWGRDTDHNWPAWRRQAAMYLGRRFR